MASQESQSSPIDIIPDALEKVLGILKKVGIVLPPFVVQAFLLILALIFLWWAVHQFRRKKMKTFLFLTGAGTLGLITLGIAINWLEQVFFPFPVEISGYVELTETANPGLLADLRLTVLDFQGDKISSGDGIVDTTNGRFVLPYKANFGVRPYTIRVTARGCSPKDFPLGRRELREGSVSLQYNCGKAP